MEYQHNFPQKIKIGAKIISLENPTFFIADIGANFDQNLDKAKQLALAAKEAGADVVKFQTFTADKIVSEPSFFKMGRRGFQGKWDKDVNEVYRQAEFPHDWHRALMDYCRKIGVMFSSSPYDFEAVDLLDELGVDFYKIGSGEITWHEMLEYIAKKNKPMILATGASTLAEVDEAISVIEKTGNHDLILLQCVTNYPAKIENANINVLKTYQTAYNILTGYSDHTPSDIVVLGAVALGGRVIEKHFTLNKKDAGPDHPHSMEPLEFKQMVARTRLLEKALGSARKQLVEEEAETVIVQRRSLHVTRDLAAGATILAGDLIELRPAIGILPKDKKVVIGHKIKNDLKKHKALTWENLA